MGRVPRRSRLDGHSGRGLSARWAGGARLVRLYGGRPASKCRGDNYESHYLITACVFAGVAALFAAILGSLGFVQSECLQGTPFLRHALRHALANSGRANEYQLHAVMGHKTRAVLPSMFRVSPD
jgi:hypothetical protein